MGYTQFAKDRYFIIPRASSFLYKIAEIELAESFELWQIQIHMIKRGAHTGAEQFRLHITSRHDDRIKLATSDRFNVSDLDGITANSWAGYATLQFNRETLVGSTGSSGDIYGVAIEFFNYTMASDQSYYWGVALDWPEPLNDQASATTAGAAMSILGYSRQ